MDSDRDYDLEVERLKRWNETGERIARRAILEYIDKFGEAYSRELKLWVPLDLSTRKISKLLRAMEAEELLVGETRNPPFDGRRGGGMQRRYYRRVDR